MKLKVQHPEYVMFSSDYSQQEPKMLAFVSKDPQMCDAFMHGRDIYATIAAIAFNKPYEECLEFHPETGEYQAEGKERRSQAKSIVLGITYGRSTVTIGEQLFGANHEMPDEEKTKRAQQIYDAVLNAFPSLKNFMAYAQNCARTKGYTETILGRRRHIPDMQLKPFEFKAMPGYVNPDIDPLDVSTLQNSSDIPERIVKDLEQEFSKLKYYGQVVRRTKELREQKIRVINNKKKITDATRQCVNCVPLNVEILTADGWKRHDQINIGDKVLSYNLNTECVEFDNVEGVHVYDSEFDVAVFSGPEFHCASTLDHKWVVAGSNGSRLVTANKIVNSKWADYSILRSGDNNFKSMCSLDDNTLEFLGWLIRDGYYSNDRYDDYHIRLTQCVKSETQRRTFDRIIGYLKNNTSIKYVVSGLQYKIIDACFEHDASAATMISRLPTENSLHCFISSLSQHQANVVLCAACTDNGTFQNENNDICCCRTIAERDAIQHLAFIAGYATDCYEIADNWWGYSGRVRPYSYVVKVLKDRTTAVYPDQIHTGKRCTCKGVWCVTTKNHTWVARSEGKVFITGNSVIQGSAADLTKMAILNLEYNDRWHQIGGRLLVPVHDELICEVPVDFYEEGRDILKNAMESAGNFMPFSIRCDVETTTRWYGLEFPCPYDKPRQFSLETLHSLSESNISWIQYHLTECEYLLPKFPDKDGNPPIGIATRGVNGIVSDELISYIKDYMSKHKVDENSFIDHIETLVQKGIVK